jgi:hypothetical protein
VVESRGVTSFEELLDLPRQDRFKDREFLEVEIQFLLAGGEESIPSPDAWITLTGRKRKRIKVNHLNFSLSDPYPTLTTDPGARNNPHGGM